QMEFLGFVLDTAAMEIRLPEEKLHHLKSLLWAWIPRKSCSKRELLSLIGSLQHASAVVRPGRVFLRRMIDLSKRQMYLDAPIRLNNDFRADLRWWATFAEGWNSVSIVGPLPSNCGFLADFKCFWIMGLWGLLSPVLVRFLLDSLSIMGRYSNCSKEAVAYCRILRIMGPANE
ncbi:MAG: hypothetical protein MJE68_06690, partial [Proteobacteria bacterium]|nr:hypothetical protein [Pseudomonadota bacterium]